MLEIIDTYPAFQKYWDHVKDLAMYEQIKIWTGERLPGRMFSPI